MEQNKLDQRRKSLIFDCNRSIRYNSKRANLFEKWERRTNLISLFAGTATFASLYQSNQYITGGISAFITILSLTALIIDYGKKNRFHQDLISEFRKLIQMLNVTEITEPLLLDVENKMGELDDKEGEPLKVLEQICYNEQVIAEGLDRKYLTPINEFQRMFANYIDICPNTMFKAN